MNYTVAVSDDGQDIMVRPIPEPATLLLFGLGILGIGAVGRKKF